MVPDVLKSWKQIGLEPRFDSFKMTFRDTAGAKAVMLMTALDVPADAVSP